MKKNLVLIGFMGTGKSSIARILSRKLGVPMVSIDDLIENREGKKIAEIFKDSGESYFRSVESQVVRDVANHESAVIDCGGGVVLNPQNMLALKKSGVLIHLTCGPEEILRRIKLQPQRPLLDVADPLAKINELLQERQPYYSQADISMDTTDGALEKAAEEIIKKVRHE
ncbi:MAG: shikimate kinase [Candidatus Omnitrophica bacterium]|nr:shikimate kinase [Candidatus Omnitrophota bacterium]